MVSNIKYNHKTELGLSHLPMPPQFRVPIADSRLLEELDRLYPENLMRLYADSFERGDGFDREFPLDFHGDQLEYAALGFTREWLRQNREELLVRLQDSFVVLANTQQFRTLEWLWEFVDEHLDTSLGVKNNLRTMLHRCMAQFSEMTLL
jgi:hypothetical protein